MHLPLPIKKRFLYLYTKYYILQEDSYFIYCFAITEKILLEKITFFPKGWVGFLTSD